jgi:hypothetical protein
VGGGERLELISVTPLSGQPVAELDQLTSCIFGRVWSFHPVVQMNLDFAPSGAAMLGQSGD